MRQVTRGACEPLAVIWVPRVKRISVKIFVSTTPNDSVDGCVQTLTSAGLILLAAQGQIYEVSPLASGRRKNTPVALPTFHSMCYATLEYWLSQQSAVHWNLNYNYNQLRFLD